MPEQPRANIYLAQQRGLSETDFSQSAHTFNFGQYVAEGREPFGALCLLNDDTLLAGASLTMRIEQPTVVVLLPIAGGLDYTIADSTTALEPGQASVLSLAAGTTYSVSNPYETERIGFLQLWLTKPPGTVEPAVSQIDFDLTQTNTLLPFLNETAAVANHPSGYQGFIGRYDGRQEDTYPVSPPEEGLTRRIFVFVLQGAFEVANRLLHQKDGLALQYSRGGQLEFEALSNDAMLILIDLPATD